MAYSPSADRNRESPVRHAADTGYSMDANLSAEREILCDDADVDASWRNRGNLQPVVEKQVFFERDKVSGSESRVVMRAKRIVIGAGECLANRTTRELSDQ